MWSPQARAAALAARHAKAGANSPGQSLRERAHMLNPHEPGSPAWHARMNEVYAPQAASATAKVNAAAHIPALSSNRPTTVHNIATQVKAYHDHVEANGPIVAPHLYYGGGAFPSTPLAQKSGAQYQTWKKAQQAKGVKFKPASSEYSRHKSSGWGMGD